MKAKDTRILATLGELHITALEAARVRNSRDYRTITSSWVVAPWESHPQVQPSPRKRAS